MKLGSRFIKTADYLGEVPVPSIALSARRQYNTALQPVFFSILSGCEGHPTAVSIAVESLVSVVLSPERFLALPPYRARITQATDETLRWEVFLGHLLDAGATRREETFASWHVFLDRDAARATTPLISVRWHRPTASVHVTRQILTHAHEAFEESPGVIGTRPTQKWVSELIGAVSVAGNDRDEAERQLARLIYLATVGVSRLPITSLESPLPCFSLGQFSYWPREVTGTSASNSPYARLQFFLQGKDPELGGRALEFALRGLPPDTDITLLADLRKLGVQRTSQLLREIFNQAALAPHTSFADRLVHLLARLASEDWFGPRAALETLSFMLRQLCRHLTAFDLTLFHSFGANYPDALLLDALLKAILHLADEQAQLVMADEARLLRRAIRAGMLLRKHYEGLRVPDAPTSMGENARVLPEPFVRVPEDQIIDHGKRRRTLFSDDPTSALFSGRTAPILERAFADLDEPRELQELGAAIFLDRPLGAFKQPGEVDRTPLVSYVAFSRFVAQRRLATAKSAGWLTGPRHEALRSRLGKLAPAGLAAAELQCCERPGVVSLADANKAAADFIILRSTRSSLDTLLRWYDWQSLADRFPAMHRWLQEDADVLLVARQESSLKSAPQLEFLRGREPRFVLSARLSSSTMAAYHELAGVEMPTSLYLVAVRDEAGRLAELHEQTILIPGLIPGIFSSR